MATKTGMLARTRQNLRARIANRCEAVITTTEVVSEFGGGMWTGIPMTFDDIFCKEFIF